MIGSAREFRQMFCHKKKWCHHHDGCSFFQKRQKDDQKPLEEKIKTLKKRNAELAAIARRLEEKAKHLQQENMKVAILLLVWERNAMQIETNWQILLSLEQAYHLQFFQYHL